MLRVPCDDEQLRQIARRKIEHYIEQHPPVQRLPRFYLVLLKPVPRVAAWPQLVTALVAGR